MVIPPPALFPAAVKLAGTAKTAALAKTALSAKGKKKKKDKKELDPFAAEPATSQPVEIRKRVKKIFGQG